MLSFETSAQNGVHSIKTSTIKLQKNSHIKLLKVISNDFTYLCYFNELIVIVMSVEKWLLAEYL